MTSEAKRPSLFLRIAAGLVLPLAMVVLAVTLTRACGHGKKVIHAYLDALRAGATVSEPVGGAEAAALTALLRRARSVSVGNFQSQEGTSCYWTTLGTDRGSTEVTFVLGQDNERVTAISALLPCDCPRDRDEPCHLEK